MDIFININLLTYKFLRFLLPRLCFTLPAKPSWLVSSRSGSSSWQKEGCRRNRETEGKKIEEYRGKWECQMPFYNRYYY